MNLMRISKMNRSLLECAFVTLFVIAALALPFANALAESPEEKGLAIAREADRRNNGFGDTKTSMEMILRNKQGEESKRKLRARGLEQANDGDKGLIIFDDPKDVQGTALLT